MGASCETKMKLCTYHRCHNDQPNLTSSPYVVALYRHHTVSPYTPCIAPTCIPARCCGIGWASSVCSAPWSLTPGRGHGRIHWAQLRGTGDGVREAGCTRPGTRGGLCLTQQCPAPKVHPGSEVSRQPNRGQLSAPIGQQRAWGEHSR